MRAADIMTTAVIAVGVDVTVREIADLLLKHRISAVPVVDADQRVVGIVSEGDLMRHAETETGPRLSSWLAAITTSEERAVQYIKSHGRTAGDVMSRNVLTVTENTPINEIAGLLEKHHIKRVPVVSDERLVGIVSRANLLHGLAAKGVSDTTTSSADDQNIRENILRVLSKEIGLDSGKINVIVEGGTVQLWGFVRTNNERKAAQIAAENTQGVKSIENHLGQVPGWIWSD